MAASVDVDEVEPASPLRGRDASTQGLRGVAVLLMVGGHVIGGPGEGIHAPAGSAWHFFAMSFTDIRMPFFAAISGFVYAMAPVTRWSHYRGLMRAKARRLILPLVVVGTVLYYLTPLSSDPDPRFVDIPLWRVYVFAYEHLWFLQSLFVIFAVVGILNVAGALTSRWGWGACTASAAVAYVAVSVPAAYNYLTVSGTLRLLPFFLLGYGLRRFGLATVRPLPAAVLGATFVVAFSLRIAVLADALAPNVATDRTLSLAVGGSAVTLLFFSRRWLRHGWLVGMGGYSFAIYLLHIPAIAAIRTVLHHVGIHGLWTLFGVGLVVGIGVPALAQRMTRSSAVIQTAVFGEKFVGHRRWRRSPPMDRRQRSVGTDADGTEGGSSPVGAAQT